MSRKSVSGLYERGMRRLVGAAIRTPIVNRAFGWRGGDGPVVVFHHIPRCGGTSLLSVLGSWYTLVTDYRSGWTAKYPRAVDLDRLSGRYCLAGHFETSGHHLRERYPEVMDSARFFPITMLRDPLGLKLSLYDFERQHGVSRTGSLEQHLVERPNFVASILAVTPNDYRDVLDRYAFIGILEHAQESVDILARLLGKTTLTMSTLNSSRSSGQELTEEMLERFRAVNSLDYAIYGYAMGRFRDLVSITAPGVDRTIREGGK